MMPSDFGYKNDNTLLGETFSLVFSWVYLSFLCQASVGPQASVKKKYEADEITLKDLSIIAI